MSKKWNLVRSAAAAIGLATSFGVHAAPVQWTAASGGNDHWYDIITDGRTWDEAVADAVTRSHLGLTGYVATVLSQAENDFIHNSVSRTQAWLGGNDRDSEGDWVWKTGPEAGLSFPFFFWAGGEPNNCCGGEDDLVINWASDGGWNDIGNPAFPSYRVAYIIEYSGISVPVPGTLGLIGMGLAALGMMRRRS
jgi:Lectin C-type domain